MALAIILLAADLTALVFSIVLAPDSALPWILTLLLAGPIYMIWREQERRRAARRKTATLLGHWRDRGKVIPFPANRQSRHYR